MWKVQDFCKYFMFSVDIYPNIWQVVSSKLLVLCSGQLVMGYKYSSSSSSSTHFIPVTVRAGSPMYKALFWKW
jgi:hypothetical protein